MGYNLSCVGTCLPHRLDKPICAFYPQIAHGQAVAFFYPAWAAYSWTGCPEKFAKLATLLDPTTSEMPLKSRAAACAGRLSDFLSRLGLGRLLNSFGVADTDLSLFAQRVTGDSRVNPVPVEPEQLAHFYNLAFDGRIS
jgi:alcohol dehydrogenase